jgi:hypothetical protein
MAPFGACLEKKRERERERVRERERKRESSAKAVCSPPYVATYIAARAGCDDVARLERF